MTQKKKKNVPKPTSSNFDCLFVLGEYFQPNVTSLLRVFLKSFCFILFCCFPKQVKMELNCSSLHDCTKPTTVALDWSKTILDHITIRSALQCILCTIWKLVLLFIFTHTQTYWETMNASIHTSLIVKIKVHLAVVFF